TGACASSTGSVAFTITAAALGADVGGIDGAVGHGSVGEVSRGSERRDLPVGREPPLLEGSEDFEAVVLAIGTGAVVADGIGEGTDVVLEGGSVLVPG